MTKKISIARAITLPLVILGAYAGRANGQTIAAEETAREAQGTMTVLSSTGSGVMTLDGGKTWQVVKPESAERLQRQLAKKISAEHQDASGATLTAAYPNPTSGATSIRYDLRQPGDISVTLHDLHGSEVLRVFEGPRAIGQYTLSLDLASVPEGVYFYRIVNGGSTIAGSTMVVTR